MLTASQHKVFPGLAVTGKGSIIVIVNASIGMFGVDWVPCRVGCRAGLDVIGAIIAMLC